MLSIPCLQGYQDVSQSAFPILQSIEPRPLERALGDLALLQALLDAERDASGDALADGLDVFAGDGLAESGGEDVIREGKAVVGDLASAEVLAVEAGDEDHVLAVRVELGVDGALVERRHLELLDGVGDDAALAVSVDDPVLGHHLGHQAALDDELELGAAGVHVEGVHTTGWRGGYRVSYHWCYAVWEETTYVQRVRRPCLSQ